MRLKMDLCGVLLQFKIYNYERSVHEKWDDQRNQRPTFCRRWGIVFIANIQVYDQLFTAR